MISLSLGGLRVDVVLTPEAGAHDSGAHGAGTQSDRAALQVLVDSFGPFVVDAATCPVPDEEVVAMRLSVDPTLVLPDVGPVPAEGLCYQRTDLRFEMGPRRRTARAAVDGSRGALEAAVELCVQGALLRRGGLVVHAVAGVDADGRAWLVPGRSGAGKSTIARTAGFSRVLADEAVILRREAPGRFRLYGTPFWSEGRTLPLQTGHAPLGVLARPLKASEAAAERYSTASAAADLLACVMFHDADPAARGLVLETACDVAASVDCVQLQFPKEGPWLNGVVQRRAEWARSSTAR